MEIDGEEALEETATSDVSDQSDRFPEPSQPQLP
jgi:hypothetical protein